MIFLDSMGGSFTLYRDILGQRSLWTKPKLFEEQKKKEIALTVVAAGVQQAGDNVRKLVFIRIDQIKDVKSACLLLVEAAL